LTGPAILRSSFGQLIVDGPLHPHNVKLRVVEQRQFDLLTEGRNIRFREKQFGRSLPLGAVFSVFR
jgi:hypothetical protein